MSNGNTRRSGPESPPTGEAIPGKPAKYLRPHYRKTAACVNGNHLARYAQETWLEALQTSCIVSVPLTAAHKTGRREFSEWLLQRPDGFEEKVIWTDEKWFVLNSAPNKQNERFWALENPKVTVNCKEQGAKKIMCWAAVVDGQVFVHWLTPGSTVNGLAYLRLLKEGLWPKIQHKVRRDSLWFQQDGATVHTTAAVRQWLAGKFDGRVISRLTERSWPSRSPDLSPLDYWFWAVALAELRRNPPATLQELQVTVERFAGNLDRNDVKRAVRNLRQRAETCVRRKGDTAENP